MFDLNLLFKTTIHVKAISKSFEDMLNLCSYGEANIPYSVHVIDHNMSITNTPIIPDSDWIKRSEKTIFDELTQSFAKNDSLNVEVVNTEFVGFTEVKQK